MLSSFLLYCDSYNKHDMQFSTRSSYLINMSLILHVPILADPKVAIMGISLTCPMDEILRIATLSDVEVTGELQAATKGETFPWDDITNRLCAWCESGLVQESITNKNDFISQWRTLWSDRQDWESFSNVSCQRTNLMKLNAAKGLMRLTLQSMY